MKTFLLLFSGILFGAGLAVSGMTNPEKVIGFLDIFGNWDPALAYVMGGAVGVFGIGQFILRKTGILYAKTPLPNTSSEPLSKKYVIGSALFGIGWGLGGFCPGPALANLTTGRIEVLLFIPVMLLGIIVAQRLFKLD